MRKRILACTAVLAILASAVPPSLAAQDKSAVERFNTAGLPKTATTALEKEIFTLLRVHKKGDLADATRIHMKLAEYYRTVGDKTRADDCVKSAEAAWTAANPEPPRASAASPGTPPFTPEGTFEASFAYVDELKVDHQWDFYVDGTFAHRVAAAGATGSGPTELGWYTLSAERLRLWQLQPKGDRTVAFHRTADGAVMNGLLMKQR